jgi:hypothetical protein
MPYSDPTHWRERAAEARRIAQNLTDEIARKHMIASAEAYERLANLAEKNSARQLAAVARPADVR